MFSDCLKKLKICWAPNVARHKKHLSLGIFFSVDFSKTWPANIGKGNISNEKVYFGVGGVLNEPTSFFTIFRFINVVSLVLKNLSTNIQDFRLIFCDKYGWALF